MNVGGETTSYIAWICCFGVCSKQNFLDVIQELSPETEKTNYARLLCARSIIKLSDYLFTFHDDYQWKLLK